MARPALIITYLTLLLTVFGLVMVGDASVVDASRDFANKWYYLKLQSGWAAIGLIGFFFCSKIPYHRLEKLAAPFLFATLALLLLVLIPGLGSKFLGARRWINLGFFSFQPAELAKLTLAIYWSALLKKTKSFLPFISVLGLVIGLVMLEPDMGTAIILSGIAVLTYFGSGGHPVKLALLISLAGVVAGLLVLIAPYRLDRVKSFLDYTRDPLGSSYHIRQILLSLGSGGPFGVGLGQSRQKYEFLPEVTTDSIFAVVGEELGLIGTSSLVIVYLIFTLAGLKIARSTSDPFGRNLALALTAWIGLQSFTNIAAMAALIPLTGIPLPFISYGGSSLVLVLVASGLLVSISRQR